MPYYDEPVTYLALAGRIFAWEFDGWQQESLSWKTGCYIHAGLSSLPTIRFTGRDAVAFFESISTNSFAKYSQGTMKHAVMCNDQGLIAAHGVLQRDTEDVLTFFAAGPWPIYQLGKSGFRLKREMVDVSIFQVAGPTSQATLERAANEELSDIGFLRFRHTTIAETKVEVARLGMSGNLAFEVRVPVADGAAVYDAIYQAGQDFGNQRLGWRTYLVNHIEGGFPQQNWTFRPADVADEGYRAFVKSRDFPAHISGSVDPANVRARYRTPLEVNWHSTTKFDHEFIGRKALEAEVANPRRKTVTLRWNPQDILDIHASLLEPGEPYKAMDLPITPTWKNGALGHADQLLKDGREIGWSSDTIYSYHYREVLSHGCIDIAEAEIGNEVTVLWGDYGSRLKPVRAVVAQYPYLDADRNSSATASKS